MTNNSKKTTEKKPIRKTTTKRVVKKAQKAEPNLNETINNQTSTYPYPKYSKGFRKMPSQIH